MGWFRRNDPVDPAEALRRESARISRDTGDWLTSKSHKFFKKELGLKGTTVGLREVHDDRTGKAQAVLPDGTKLALELADGTIIVSLAGKPLFQLREHYDMEFTPLGLQASTLDGKKGMSKLELLQTIETVRQEMPALSAVDQAPASTAAAATVEQTREI